MIPLRFQDAAISRRWSRPDTGLQPRCPSARRHSSPPLTSASKKTPAKCPYASAFRAIRLSLFTSLSPIPLPLMSVTLTARTRSLCRRLGLRHTRRCQTSSAAVHRWRDSSPQTALTTSGASFARQRARRRRLHGSRPDRLQTLLYSDDGRRFERQFGADLSAPPTFLVAAADAGANFFASFSAPMVTASGSRRPNMVSAGHE